MSDSYECVGDIEMPFGFEEMPGLFQDMESPFAGFEGGLFGFDNQSLDDEELPAISGDAVGESESASVKAPLDVEPALESSEDGDERTIMVIGDLTAVSDFFGLR